MNGENPFRIVLIVVIVLQTVLSLSYLRRTGAGATIFRKRAEGIIFTVAIAVFYIGYGLAVVAYLVNPNWMAWSALSLSPWIRWVGTIPLLFGAYWMMWGLHHIGNNITISIETKDDHNLITTGPYRWVRHPLYTGGMVEALGLCLMVANWFVAISAGLFWVLIALRTPLEEKRLIETFGDEYRQYTKRVGRFFPKM